MPLRFAMTCSIGAGEQITVDCCQWNPVSGVIEHENVQDMVKMAKEALTIVDDRAYELRMRVLAVSGLNDYFTPGEWQKVISVIDVMSGRQDAQRVKAVWDSIREENEELERGRLAAAQKEILCTCYNDKVDSICPVHLGEENV